MFSVQRTKSELQYVTTAQCTVEIGSGHKASRKVEKWGGGGMGSMAAVLASCTMSWSALNGLVLSFLHKRVQKNPFTL